MGRKGLLAIVLLSLFIAFILKIFSGSLRTMKTFTCQWKNLSHRL